MQGRFVDVVWEGSTLSWELVSRAGLRPQVPHESQDANGEPGALCRHRCFLPEGVASDSNAFYVHGFFALTIILVQREEKESLKFTVKPLCFMPLSQLILRMKERISSQAKNTFGKKGRWKFQRVYFKHISDCVGMEVYGGSLNILLTVFLISEKDTELRQARQHQLNFIRFKQFQILFAISTCTPKAVPYTSAIQETRGNMEWK